jgi:hypothetical protein
LGFLLPLLYLSAARSRVGHRGGLHKGSSARQLSPTPGSLRSSIAWARDRHQVRHGPSHGSRSRLRARARCAFPRKSQPLSYCISTDFGFLRVWGNGHVRRDGMREGISVSGALSRGITRAELLLPTDPGCCTFTREACGRQGGRRQNPRRFVGHSVPESWCFWARGGGTVSLRDGGISLPFTTV